MARQTRNSRRSKPGTTIDGTATQKTGDAPKGSDAATTSDAAKDDATVMSSAKASEGTKSSAAASADAKASGNEPRSDDKGAIAASNEQAVADAANKAPEPTSGVAKGGAGASGPGKDAPKIDDAAKAGDAREGDGPESDKKDAIAASNERATADAANKAPEPTGGVAKGGAGASGPGKDAPKISTRDTVSRDTRAAAGGSAAAASSASGPGRDADNDNKSSGLVPGLIGGALALAGAWVLSLLGLFGGGNDVEVLRAELDEVRGTIPAQVESVDPATVIALDERVAQIEALQGEPADAAILPPEVAERIDRLEAALAEGSGTGDLSTLETRLAALEAVGPSDSGETVEALENRFAEIETTLGAGDTEARQALQGLQARLEELAQGQETRIQELAANQETTLAETAATVAGTVAALATVRDSIDGLRSDVEALNEAVVTADEAATGRFGDIDANLGTVTNRIETLRTQIANLERGGEERGTRINEIAANLETATTRLDDVAGRVDDLSGRTGQIATRVESNASELEELNTIVEESRSDTTVARAIAASNLKSAIDRGTSFAPELEAYASVAAEPGEIEPLREFAGRGVPTLPELIERFDSASADIIATQYAVGEDAGAAAQLGASLRSLVQVRPVGEAASGNEIGAIVTRMDEALESGDLQAVISEGEQLPPEALEEAQPFLDDVRARQTANQLIDTALSRAIRPAG